MLEHVRESGASREYKLRHLLLIFSGEQMACRGGKSDVTSLVSCWWCSVCT
jgi:hypothetical protein